VPFTQAPQRIGWRERPATYIVCTEDLATPAAAQRARVRGDARTVEFEAGHHPFLSRPEDFARALADELETA
jgi:pimeloyl-ACP methyl ester carboxylesterase